ncbi:MAG: hypothetical protein M0Q25_08160 [Sulfurospirillaceae bacterium]|jgi:hypothetical protein|nr:hypothetical protein [Sulfurospirillaceae bacterium]MDY0238761.1 hypothetical protein [Campylobacterales bacterium]
MKKLLLSTVIFSCSLLLASESSSTISPSFDCSNEAKLNRVERLICSDEELINYQKEIERQYKLVSKLVGTNDAGRKNRNVSEIYQYLNDKRDKCKTKECLLKFYDTYDFFVGAIEWSMQEINEKFERISFNSFMRIYEWHQSIPGSEESDIKLCKNLFDDLVNSLNNITIIKPIVQMVTYDDERLKKALGACYEIAANATIESFYYNNILNNYYSLWSVDIDKDGVKELLIVKNNITWQLLDTKKCETALKDPNFNPKKDKVYTAIDYTKSEGFPVTPPILVDYDNSIRMIDSSFAYKDSGYMSINTLSETINFQKSSQYQGVGSYQIFYNTCMGSFYKK